MNVTEIMEKVAKNQITPAEATRLLSNPVKKKVEIKVGNKSNVVVKLSSQMIYPTTLKANQWLELLDNAEKIREFIEANRSKLDWS